MANSGVKIKLHNPGLTRFRLEERFYNHVQPIVAEKILADCNHFVRMQSGTLANSARIEEKGKIIRWKTPYAKRVYYTGTPRKNVNPNASLRWCEKAKIQFGNSWGIQASELMKG